MNVDTERTVNSILKNGWYRKGTTMGEGGWSKIPTHWKTYVLSSLDPDNEFSDEIKAKSDEIALKAFGELYHLDQISSYDIYERITTFRTLVEKLG